MSTAASASARASKVSSRLANMLLCSCEGGNEKSEKEVVKEDDAGKKARHRQTALSAGTRNTLGLFLQKRQVIKINTKTVKAKFARACFQEDHRLFEWFPCET